MDYRLTIAEWYAYFDLVIKVYSSEHKQKSSNINSEYMYAILQEEE